MGIHYGDVNATCLDAVQDAEASTLAGENILYPGAEWNTEEMDSWSIPGVTEQQMRPDRTKGMYHFGVFSVLIQTRLSLEDIYAREKIASKFRTVLEGNRFTIKDYISSDGSGTVGIVEFEEGVLLLALNHIDGVYNGTLRFDLSIMEGS
jgi:hypothetical protein